MKKCGKVKRLKKMKIDDIELDYLIWAVQFTMDYTAEDCVDYSELLNVKDLLEEVKNDIKK